MRPQITAIIAREIGGIACNNEINHVYYTIVITIILTEVYRRIQRIYCRYKYVCHIIITLWRSARIIHPHWTDNIELRIEHTHTVVVIIIPCATGTGYKIAIRTIIACIVFLIHEVVEIIVSVSKRFIRIFNKYDKTTKILIVSPARIHQLITIVANELALSNGLLVCEALLER